MAELTNKVTSNTTKIEQNAKQITLQAKSITETSNKIDNLQIGGRNLLRNTAFNTLEYWSARNANLAIVDGWCEVTINDTWSGIVQHFIPEKGVDYIISYEAYLVDTKATSALLECDFGVPDNLLQITKEPTKYSKEVPYPVDSGNNINFQLALTEIGKKWRIRNIKLEKGNKATDWTPAPEDLENDLHNNYYSKTQTDAQIKTATDNITLSVSEKYSTKSSSMASQKEEYYVSTSPNTLNGGSWSPTQPKWQDGKYIWRRILMTMGDGKQIYIPSESGICIQGNTGAKGDTGPQGPQGVQGLKGDKGATGETGATGPQGLKGDTGLQGPQGVKGDTGAQGPQGIQGPQGVQGAKGTDGKTYYTWIKYADSPTSGMSDSPTGKLYLGVAYNKSTATESSNYSDYSWSLIKGDKGDRGATGATGATGPQGATGAQGPTGPTGNGIKSIAYTYARTTSQTAPAASAITSTTMPTLDATNNLH